MKTVVVATQYPKRKIPLRGTYFYGEELAQYWYDNVSTDVSVFLAQDGIDVSERYTWLAPRTTDLECDLLLFNWVANLAEVPQSLLFSAKKICFLNSANLDAFFEKALVDHLDTLASIRSKSYLLMEPGFETKTTDLPFFETNKVIPIHRGFYFNYYSPLGENKTTNWYLYSNDYVTQFRELHVNNRSIIAAKNFAKTHNYLYTHDTYDSANPGNFYPGMFYTRYMDYMPRLPYEFWFYKKPVVLLDVSDGLIKRGVTKELLYKELILDESCFPKWDITHLLNII